jgi:hypothetical protein
VESSQGGAAVPADAARTAAIAKTAALTETN